MTLRLDPKYHGVRVARVRPKESALIKRGKFAELWAITKDKEAVFRFEAVSFGSGYQWVPMYFEAFMGDKMYTQKEALEALGLR